MSHSVNTQINAGNRRGPTPGRIAIALAVLAIAILSATSYLASRTSHQDPSVMPRELSRSALLLRNEILFVRGESEPFSGTMVELYPDGST